MPYCPECGKRVSDTAKFCRNCGASQAEEAGGEDPGVKTLPETPACKTCKTLLLPEDKFCSNCGEKVAGPGPVIITGPADTPAPVPEPVCASCGAVLVSDARFCASCGNPAGVQPPAQEPVATETPEAPDPRVCASCGSRLKGTEKFCGICGKAAATAAGTVVVVQPPPQPPSPPVCGSCGEILSDDAKFCGGCGVPVGGVPPAGIPARKTPPVLPETGEAVLGVVPNARKMKLLGAASDTYTIIVTDQRMIFSRVTRQLLSAAIADANTRAKEEGKGLLGIVGDQLAVSFGFGHRYESMPPEDALHESPGNFALGNRRISGITLELTSTKQAGLDGHELKMIIQSPDGKFEFFIAQDDRFTSLLQSTYGERVKVPPGLFSTGPVRVRFF